MALTDRLRLYLRTGSYTIVGCCCEDPLVVVLRKTRATSVRDGGSVSSCWSALCSVTLHGDEDYSSQYRESAEQPL